MKEYIIRKEKNIEYVEFKIKYVKGFTLILFYEFKHI